MSVSSPAVSDARPTATDSQIAYFEVDLTPSLDRAWGVKIAVSSSVPADATGLVVPVAVGEGAVPGELGVGRAALAAAGFEGRAGQTLVLPRAGGPVLVAVGVGEPGRLDAATLRDAAAAFARAVAKHEHLAISLENTTAVPPEVAARAVVEGVLLARYRYDPFHTEPTAVPLAQLTLVAGADRADAVRAGAEQGRLMAEAGMLARDLCNAPPSYLTAERMAEVAQRVAADRGLEVEVFDRRALLELGCGGLLGVNAGSAHEPRMIKLTYRPKTGAARGHLCLVGKGIMYDSGGINLKPSDAMHMLMKLDMSGAGAILGAMSAMTALECPTAVTGYLMCTDNMPSGSALKMGDVLKIRGGKTVEVQNTDAEGRLVMADALVLSVEERPDAIVDIATLTGAALRALGTKVAAVFGNDQALVDQVRAAAERTDEPVWQLPLEKRYRSLLDSEVADLGNMGGDGVAAGAITAALFLAEFVGEVPWAHLDIAGTMSVPADDSWRSRGATGFGARLLLDLALAFAPARA
jgi:leucyl aminopeptidase